MYSKYVNVMYLVKYSSGLWDDWQTFCLFVTHDKDIAERYVKKMNRIGKKLSAYYEDLYWQDETKFTEDRLVIISDKRDKWGQFDNCFIVPVEVR